MRKPGIGEICIIGLLCYYLIGWSWSVVVILSSGLVFMFCLHLKKTYSVWSAQNVPGPTPWPILGNCGRFKKGNQAFALENRAKYGKIWGSFFLMMPELFVCDLDSLRNVLVKNFDCFTNRRTFRPKDVGERPNPHLFDVAIIALFDHKWKNVRNMMTPTFTAGKIKLTIPLITQAVDTLVEVLGERFQKGESINIKETFGCFSMDVIAAAAFGTRVDSQRNPEHPLVVNAKEAFNFSFKSPVLWFTLFFPLVTQFLNERLFITTMFPQVQSFFVPTMARLLAQRRSDPKSPPDFLQLMINANVSHGTSGQSEDGSKATALTDLELISQLVTFLLAGYDTTSNALQFVAYLLATNPDCQQRCYEEVMDAFGGNDNLSYDDLQQKFDYLEACICESLRLYPPAYQFDRVASKPYDLNGITVPQDVAVVVPIFAIHYAEENYPEPTKFDPERFMPEQRKSRDPLAFLPFGYGPRNCIGMRFAIIEMKLSMLLRKFQFATCPKTEIPLEIDSTGISLKPKKPMFLDLKLR